MLSPPSNGPAVGRVVAVSGSSDGVGAGLIVAAKVGAASVGVAAKVGVAAEVGVAADVGVASSVGVAARVGVAVARGTTLFEMVAEQLSHEPPP